MTKKHYYSCLITWILKLQIYLLTILCVGCVIIFWLIAITFANQVQSLTKHVYGSTTIQGYLPLNLSTYLWTTVLHKKNYCHLDLESDVKYLYSSFKSEKAENDSERSFKKEGEFLFVYPTVKYLMIIFGF